MAVSQSYNVLWSTGILFVILPHFSLGLLSDYKICGDSECESIMSRVQAIRDHQGKDCRFLSFRKGVTFFVYHKLTGKREDLWAGSIEKQFGYFPKDAVKEEQVHAAVEKVVETQESDFFCMDELGFIIDSSHLDSDDDDYDDKIQNQESETTQTTSYTEDTGAESPSTSEEVPTEPPVSARETEDTSAEAEESENADDAAPGTQMEAREAPAAPGEQGGSASSPWLSSSVTGWLGLATEDEPGEPAERGTKDEKTETQAEASFTSSVTGWLGLGGEGKPDDIVKNTEDGKESADSLTSTMTGWLGLGGENKKGHSAEEREADEEQEPAETFRSRRMSLDLEGSQLHEEEKEEMGTLDWLGNGLSNTLGFGVTNQEAGHEGATEREAEETVQKEEEQPGLGSWFDVGIGDILGFRKEKSEAVERTESVLKEREEIPVDTSQSQPSLTEEEISQTSNASQVEDPPKDQSVPSDIEIVSGTNNNDGGSLDGGKDSVSSEDVAPEVNQKDSDLLEEKSEAVGEMSSMLDSEEEEAHIVSEDIEKEENILDGERSVEMEGEDHQMPKSIENVDDDNIEPGKDKDDTDQDFLTRYDINLESDSARSLDLNVDSTERSEGEEDRTEGTVEERSDIQNKIYNTDESSDQSGKSGPRRDDHEGEGRNADRDELQREISPIYADGSAEQSQVSGAAEERYEPVSTEEDTLTAHREENNTYLSDSLALIGNNTDTETNQGELTRSLSASESTPEMEDDADQNSVSTDTQQSEGDAHMLTETEKAGEDNVQTVQTETTGLEEYVLNESGLKSGTGSETETDEDEDERQDEVEELKEEEKSQEIKEIREEVKEEDHHNKVEEVKEEENQGEEEELKKEEKGDEMEEVNEEREQEEGGELQGEKKQEEVEELKEEEKLQQTEELIEENQKLKLLKEEETREELKVVEEEKEKEAKEEEKQVKSSHFKADMENTDRAESESFEKGTQGNLKCENERCPHASKDGLVRDGDENNFEKIVTAVDEAEIVTGKQNPRNDNDQILADRTGVSRAVPSEGMETDEERKQDKEEKLNYDAEADEGVKEQGEKKNSDPDITGSEGVRSNNADRISDFNGKTDYTDNDLLPSGESGQNSISKLDLLGKTADDKEDDQLSSSEAKNTNLSNDKVLHQGDETKPEDTETSNNEISNEKRTKHLHSDQKIDTEKEPDKEEGDIHVKDDGVRVNEDAQHPAGHSTGKAGTKSRGALGLFNNAVSLFRQTPSTESTESEPSFDSVETSGSHTPLTPEQKIDSTTDSTQAYVEDLHSNATIILLEQQQQPTPPTVIQTSFPPATQTDSHPRPLSPTTGSPLQAKTLSKHYKNLLTYMNADETTVLTELFGGHKLQFLDYMLGKTDSNTDDPDSDESIVLDIERLLHYHRETLVAPSMRLADAPQEDKEKTSTLIALQKLEMLLGRVRETFHKAKLDVSKINHQDETIKGGSNKMSGSSVGLDSNTPRDEQMGMDKEKVRHLSGGIEEEWVTEDKKREEKENRGEDERVSPESRPHVQPGTPQPLEGPGVMNRMLDFVHQMAEDSTTHVHAARKLTAWLTVQVVSSLPDDIRPGPDLYGVPWEPVIITSLVGLMTMLLFTCRCYSSVKSRLYRSRERWMAEQVAQLLDEKCKVLETLSKCQQEYDDLENSLRDSGVLAQTQKTEHLEGKARQLGHAKRELERDLNQLKDQLDQQKDHRIEQERRIAVLEENMKTFDEETKDLQSQDEQAQTTLKVYNMNSDRLQRNLETAGEENALLQESNAQLRQQVEGWAERVSELEAEMSRCEATHSGMLQDVANKDERIVSLTDLLLSMKAWDSDLEEEGEEGGEKETSNGTAGKEAENGKGGREDTQGHLQKVQKLIYAAKLNADLKSVDEDKDRAFAKLNDEVKAKEDLLVGIKELENEKLSLQSSTEQYSDQVQRLQQKLHIMTEMYQENELKLHRLLTVEEKERLQKEDKLNKADKNIALAMEELNNYRQRAGEMEEELEKSKQSYQTQISAHEKKAHNNWLAARAADRELSDIRRENALLRQKLTDTQFKLDALDKDPYALDNLARPLPFRAERSPYGPSPLGRPASETRPFLSPPTLMDGPPARLSPRVPRGPVEPPGGHGEMERSGGPHSDSGSISPTWERDRRGPPTGPPGHLGPPGYMFPEPGGPMYRRPLPPPGALGHLPPLGSLPPGPLHLRGLPSGPPHPVDMADGSYRENSLGPGEQEHREQFGPDRRTPPEGDPRMGGAPPPGPLMGPMDGPFPRRSPYGPPPPDFYPPRGPGAPPMMPMWAPPLPGMMFPPPRFSTGGPPLPPAPHPHHVPTMRPSLPVGLPPPSMGPLPPQQSLPSPPHSQSPEEHTPMPEDAI